jgi:hypothetical protein
LGRVFNFKLGCSVSEKCNCRACTQPLLELKTWPRFHPVSRSLSMDSDGKNISKSVPIT